jgi:hypothetical protein
MADNVPGVSEVPSEARNLDGALAKSDTHLLGVGNSPEVSVSEQRVGRCGSICISAFTYLYFYNNYKYPLSDI